MKKIYFIILYFTLPTASNLYGQKQFCADSSIRIKYFFNRPFVNLSNNYDTTGRNIFFGTGPQNNNSNSAIIALKTNWGDSVYWVKKFYLNNIQISCANSFDAPGNTLLCVGFWGNSSDLLLTRIDTSGNVLWAKRYRLSQSHLGANNGLPNYKNILVTNNAIYFNIYFSAGGAVGDYYIIGKLDLNGNIIWTKSFKKNINSYTDHIISDAPVLYKDTVLFVSNVQEYNNITGNTLKRYTVITKLKDTDGSVIESIAYKTAPSNMIKGIIPQYMKLNTDNSFSITGTMSIPQSNNGTPSMGSDFTFNLTLDKNLTPIYSSYYNHPLLNLDGPYYTFDFNSLNQSAFLHSLSFGNDRYLVTFDENKNILRSRKFLIPPTITARSYIKFDEKQNIHFTYNYRQNNKSVIEYARISDLAAANTVGCFGVDTSILQPVPFSLTMEPFTWDIEYTNIVSSFPVNLLEETETVTNQVICKQVSYCDSVKIKGNTTVCLSGMGVRYSVYQNPECLKGIVWQPDTNFATIINNEADTAITLQFKKTGKFYLKATVNNCVVTDSILITIIAAPAGLQLNRDSSLCPGSSILLSVNPLYKTYQWQDGSTQNTFRVTSPGFYHITAIDSCGNVVKDSLQVSLVDTSFNLPSVLPFCIFDTARLLLPVGINSISWQPSVAGLLKNNELLLFPKQPVSYTISAKRPPGCSMQHTIRFIEQNCPEWIRFPSAFTPNADGLNDYFKPVVSGQLATYNLKIFNRYGQLIFTSNNPYSGWDGRYSGTTQVIGTYVFISRYKFTTGTEQVSKGTIMLIR